MDDLHGLGAAWLLDNIDSWTTDIKYMRPSEFCAQHRYLPASTTPRPGMWDPSLFPYWIEPLDMFDQRHPAREINLLKGVQLGFTVSLLENLLFYIICCLRSSPAIMVSADKELMTKRIEDNILPSLTASGFDVIQSNDEKNHRKTGQTKNLLQWAGGGWLLPLGAQNQNKMRSNSAPYLLLDEIAGWPETGDQGDSMALYKARTDAYEQQRKIYAGSTPLHPNDHAVKGFLRGDQRHYMVRCLSCNYPQHIEMERVNKETGLVGGIIWDTQNNKLVSESVRYRCVNCGHDHFESDKIKLFSPDEGAHWKPTADPVAEGIYSYKIPGWYSPYGFKSWVGCVQMWLDAFDPKTKQTKDVKLFQVFYNNVLAKPFEQGGAKIKDSHVDGQRRMCYRRGEIPNFYAQQYSGSKIMFLTCQVDVHKSNLAVAVTGWTAGLRMYLIDYWRFEREDETGDCSQNNHPVWQRLQKLIENTVYAADDGTTYRITQTFIDGGYKQASVVDFCSQYSSGVYPILGRDRPGKSDKIREFAQFPTQLGTIGYRVTVDYYKDRLEPLLRQKWHGDDGDQPHYQVNFPVDATQEELKELTVEQRIEKTAKSGFKSYEWHRPDRTSNELWDLLVYGSASAEIVAHRICRELFKLDNVNWQDFYSFCLNPENGQLFGRVDPK